MVDITIPILPIFPTITTTEITITHGPTTITITTVTAIPGRITTTIATTIITTTDRMAQEIMVGVMVAAFPTTVDTIPFINRSANNDC